ncbi:MAG: cell envelope integrity protein TolA [Gammaproteobacteria bacterium]|jgi:colicin import membrane protein|nr:cell envelope integrity protein TolA [Gammaproteobacteria bacterium]MBT7603469.1 cell envelope integrity protein TolA [Gammaproteobacteria bacterium]
MNNFNKIKFVIIIKVLIVHFIIILLLDLNFSLLFNQDEKNLNDIKNAKFINLKSISIEELEKNRKKLEDRKRKLKALKKKKLEAKKKKNLEAKKKKKLEAENKKKLDAENKKKLDAQNKKKTLEKLKKDEESELISYELKKIEKELRELEELEQIIKRQIIRNSQLNDAETEYILTIKSKIENNWLIPHDTKHDKICTVVLSQLPSGKVTNVKLHACMGDSLYKDSLINAVWKSSPLPIAPDVEVFTENIVLQFEEPK